MSKTDTQSYWERSEVKRNHQRKVRLLEKMVNSEVDLKKFWKHVSVKSKRECWDWEYAVNWNGYGIYVLNSKEDRITMTVHRIAYFIGNRILPKALVCHSCDNRRCVNPAHLWIGSYQDNRTDSVQKKRQCVGHDVYSSRLEESHVKEMRLLYFVCGYSNRELQHKYGVTFKTIRDVLTRLTWKHLPVEDFEDTSEFITT